VDRYRDFGPTIIRAFAATFLIYMSQDNVFSDEQMTEFERFLHGFGFPMVPLSARVSVFSQFTAGILFAVGLLVRPAAAVMVFNFVVALTVVHTKQPFQAALAPSAMLASALSLFLTGAGALSLDSWLALRKRRTVEARGR
jgi:putative oxidoreductase